MGAQRAEAVMEDAVELGLAVMALMTVVLAVGLAFYGIINWGRHSGK